MSARTVQIARSVAVIGATAATIIGITYAAIGDVSTATLGSSTLSASAFLQIAPDSNDAPGTFQTTVPGFNATTANMRFGSERAAGKFWLKNIATGDQALVLSVPTAPTLTGVTAAGVHVHVKRGAVEELNTTLAQLQAPNPGVAFTQQLSPSAGGTQYSLFYTIDPPAGGGTTANVGSFELTFTGTEL